MPESHVTAAGISETLNGLEITVWLKPFFFQLRREKVNGKFEFHPRNSSETA
jgi:hypothetical protein